VHEVLARVDHVPDRLVDLIVERSDGNPFFVEEIVKMFRGHGVIVDADGDGWTITPGDVDPADVPATIAGVLQARLDQLSPEDLLALQHAAVIGRTFWDDAVAALGDRPGPANPFTVALQRELVYPQEDSWFTGSAEFVFKHALLRDVTYETVLLRDRGDLHARAARWLTERAGDRVDEYLDTIADHHHRAGDFDKAAACLSRAAVVAFERGLIPVALEKMDEAIEEWARADEPVPVDALLLIGEAQRRRGDADAADRALRAVLERAHTDDAEDREHRAAALYLLSEVAFDRGDETEERTVLEEGLRLVGGDRSLVVARLEVGLAWWETRHGERALGVEHGRRALALAEELNSDRMRWRAHNVLGAMAAMGGDLDGAERHTRTSVQIAQALGDMVGEAVSIGNLGVVLHLVGDTTGSVDYYVDAIAHYDRDLEFRAAIVDPVGTIVSTFNRAQVLVRLGEFDEAAVSIRAGLAVARRSNFARHLILGLLVEADRLVNLGDVGHGLDLLALVRTHPTVQRTDEQEIERILQHASLPADALYDRPPTDSSNDLDAAVQAILDR